MSREAEIRQHLIDQRLVAAGWSQEQHNLTTEYFLSGNHHKQPVREQAAHYSSSSTPSGRRFVDYVLLGDDGRPIALVEAKRDTRSPWEGQEQALEYAEMLEQQTGRRPFIFLTNGDEIIFLEKDRFPARKISQFYTPRDLADLELLHLYSQPLHLFQSDPAIVDREYQKLAIQAVIDGLKLKKRKFLLVMATGTGKTRTVIALVDLLLRAGWVRRVLFLADRRELVKQASDAFEVHIPHESRVRIEGGAIPYDARIHFATYPSMMQVYRQLSIGYYDLIIADESHRSIYNHYKALLDHFDALQIGLTATPTDHIEHNTYELFGCSDDIPSFEYPFDIAVEEKHLVTFKVWEARTRFQIEGIKAGELPYEFQKQIVEQGLELDEINFEGSDLERKVTNTGTNDLLVDEFMQECRRDGRGLPYKSIIFAVSHNHALELYQSFYRRYPDLQARGLAKVIDSHMERAEKMLDDFKHRDMPRVAISVDMLDTGIDVPAIQNLVFAKPVYSYVKFWQMIGRGTRLWEDPISRQKKNDFLIIDHWQNFKTFEKNREGKVTHPTESLPARLFRARLEKLALARSLQKPDLAEQTLIQLHDMLDKLSDANVQVQAYATELRLFREDTTWEYLDISPDGRLYRFIAPLMRFLPDLDEPTLLFELHTEELAVAYLHNDTDLIARLREQLLDELERLPKHLPEVKAVERMRTWPQSTDFWTHLDMQRILELQKELKPVMRYRESRPHVLIKLSLPDTVSVRRWITYGPAGEGAFVDDYRGQVEAWVKEMAEHVPTLIKIKQRQQPDVAEMQALATLLNKPDLFIREEILRQVYENPTMRLIDFVRHVLDVQRQPSREERIEAAIQRFLHEHPGFNSIQRRFVYTLQSVLMLQSEEDGQDLAAFTSAHLMQAPFNRIGKADDLFSAHELAELVQFANNQVA